MFIIKTLVSVLFVLKSIQARSYNPCELHNELLNIHNLTENESRNLTCVAQKYSGLNTNIIGGDKYGIFQISKKWCGQENVGGECKIKCTDLLDDDITDDILCAQKVFQKLGKRAWRLNRNTGCREQFKYLDENCHKEILINDDNFQVQQDFCESARELMTLYDISKIDALIWSCILEYNKTGNFKLQREDENGRSVDDDDSCVKARDVRCAIKNHKQTGISGFSNWPGYDQHCKNISNRLCFELSDGNSDDKSKIRENVEIVKHFLNIEGSTTTTTQRPKKAFTTSTEISLIIEDEDGKITQFSNADITTESNSESKQTTEFLSNTLEKPSDNEKSTIEGYSKVRIMFADQKNIAETTETLETTSISLEELPLINAVSQSSNNVPKLIENTTDEFELKYFEAIDKCTLAKDMNDSGHIPENLIPTFVCIAEHESGLNVSFIVSDGLQSKYGLFQIDNQVYCSTNDHIHQCDVLCAHLVDDQFDNDFECVRHIFKKEGLAYWPSYERSCKNINSNSLDYCYEKYTTSHRPFTILNKEAELSKTQLTESTTVATMLNNFSETLINANDSVTNEDALDFCDLAHQIFVNETVSLDDLVNYVCIADQSSHLKPKGTSIDDEKIGIFGLRKNNTCGNEEAIGICSMFCTNLLDDDLSDDVKCMIKIYNEYGLSEWNIEKKDCLIYKSKILQCIDDNKFPLPSDDEDSSEITPIIEAIEVNYPEVKDRKKIIDNNLESKEEHKIEAIENTVKVDEIELTTLAFENTQQIEETTFKSIYGEISTDLSDVTSHKDDAIMDNLRNLKQTTTKIGEHIAEIDFDKEMTTTELDKSFEDTTLNTWTTKNSAEDFNEIKESDEKILKNNEDMDQGSYNVLHTTGKIIDDDSNLNLEQITVKFKINEDFEDVTEDENTFMKNYGNIDGDDLENAVFEDTTENMPENKMTTISPETVSANDSIEISTLEITTNVTNDDDKSVISNLEEEQEVPIKFEKDSTAPKLIAEEQNQREFEHSTETTETTLKISTENLEIDENKGTTTDAEIKFFDDFERSTFPTDDQILIDTSNTKQILDEDNSSESIQAITPDMSETNDFLENIEKSFREKELEGTNSSEESNLKHIRNNILNGNSEGLTENEHKHDQKLILKNNSDSKENLEMTTIPYENTLNLEVTEEPMSKSTTESLYYTSTNEVPKKIEKDSATPELLAEEQNQKEFENTTETTETTSKISTENLENEEIKDTTTDEEIEFFDDFEKSTFQPDDQILIDTTEDLILKSADERIASEKISNTKQILDENESSESMQATTPDMSETNDFLENTEKSFREKELEETNSSEESNIKPIKNNILHGNSEGLTENEQEHNQKLILKNKSDSKENAETTTIPYENTLNIEVTEEPMLKSTTESLYYTSIREIITEFEKAELLNAEKFTKRNQDYPGVEYEMTERNFIDESATTSEIEVLDLVSTLKDSMDEVEFLSTTESLIHENTINTIEEVGNGIELFSLKNLSNEIFEAATKINSTNILNFLSIDKCALAQYMNESSFPENLIPTFICIAEHESDLNVSTVKIHQSHKKYGLFQIDDEIYCSTNEKINKCDVLCAHLNDNQFDNDMECVQQIYKKEGLGYWPSYEKACKNTSPNSLDYCYQQFTTSHRPFTIVTSDDELVKSKSPATDILHINNVQIIAELPKHRYTDSESRFILRRYDLCELSRELYKQNITVNNIPSFLCIADLKSQLKIRVPIQDEEHFGLFAINSQFCGKNKADGLCSLNCFDLWDENIEDDIECIHKIRQSNMTDEYILNADICQVYNQKLFECFNKNEFQTTVRPKITEAYADSESNNLIKENEIENKMASQNSKYSSDQTTDLTFRSKNSEIESNEDTTEESVIGVQTNSENILDTEIYNQMTVKNDLETMSKNLEIVTQKIENMTLNEETVVPNSDLLSKQIIDATGSQKQEIMDQQKTWINQETSTETFNSMDQTTSKIIQTLLPTVNTDKAESISISGTSKHSQNENFPLIKINLPRELLNNKQLSKQVELLIKTYSYSDILPNNGTVVFNFFNFNIYGENHDINYSIHPASQPINDEN